MLGLDGAQHTVEANVGDRNHTNYPLLLGRDVLRRYRPDAGPPIWSSAAAPREG